MTEPRGAAPLRPIALVGWVAFILLALYTVLLGGGWAGIYATGLRSLSLGIIAIGAVGWVALATLRPAWRPRTEIWPAVLAPVAALAISTATSPTPRLGLEYVAWTILLTGLYLFLVALLRHRAARDRIGGLAAGIALLVGSAYVVEVVRQWLEFWELVGRLTPPPLRPNFAGLELGNPSAVMTVMVLLWVAALAGLGTATAARRAVLGVAGVLTLFAIVVSGSRAGWLGLALAVGGVGLLWLLSPGHRGRVGAALGDRRVRAGLVVAGLVGVLGAIVVLPGFMLRAGAAGEDLRIQYATVAVRQFEDAPLTGRGPGTWTAERIERTLAGEPDYYIPHAHDIYVQAAGELGLVGMAAGAVLLATVGWLIVGGIRGDDVDRRRYGWCALLGLAYFAAHQLLDFYANMPAALFAAAIPVALLDATAVARLPGVVGRPPVWLRRAAAAGLVVAAAVSIAGLARAEGIAAVEQEAVALVNAGDLTGALAPAGDASAADPDLPTYSLTLGLAAMSGGDFQTAAAAFRRAAEADDLPHAWLDVAAAEAARGRTTDARAAVDRALRLGVQQPAVIYAAGALLDRLGDRAAADDAYLEALVDLPTLAGDPSWTSDEGLAGRWPDLLERAVAMAPASAWELLLMAGDPDRARASTGMAPDPDLADLVVEAWEGDAAAISAIEARVSADPFDLGALAWAARVNAHAGDEEAADRYRRWADLVNGTAAQGGHEVRILQDERAAGDQARAGNLSTFHGHYVYRRPTPWDLLAAGLPRLILE